MIIENAEALKSWLTSSLGRICDADPSALAKYVLALVKKDKEENELYEFCLDQLDVFLLKDTKLFVNLLFDTLRTKSYLYNTKKPDSSLMNSKLSGSISSTIKQEDRDFEKVELEKEAHSKINSEKTYSYKGAGGCSASIISKDTSTHTKKLGEIPLPDDSYKKLSSFKRESTKIYKHDQELSHDKKQTENIMNKSDKISKKDGITKSSHLITSVNSRTSYSSLSGEKTDEQIKYDIWAEKECGNKNELQKREHPNDYANTDYKSKDREMHFDSYKSSSYLLVNNNPGKNFKRCKDYDEKGYCMQGDFCQYDHGSDPVVVEDVSILTFGASMTNVTSSSDSIVNTLVPPSADPHVQNAKIKSPMPPPPPSSPPPLPPPPPPLPPLPPSGSYIPEPYNPEAPGMNINSPFWITPPPLLNSISQSLSGMSNIQYHHHNTKPLRPRELIGVPTHTVEERERVTSSTSLLDEKSPREATISNFNADGRSGVKRKGFDFSRLGPKPKIPNTETRNTILEVRKLPKHLNNIAALNNHFSKFGKVTNIQVCFENDPEAALVQFQKHSEATAAYKSTEAVLNNRFIKVFWHNSFSFKDKTLDVSIEDTPKLLDSVSSAADSNINSLLSTNFVVEKPVSERAITYSTRGNLCRTVFNPTLLKKTETVLPNICSRTQKDEYKALGKRLELHKKKQEFLESQIQSQKFILARLSKAKNEKEKAFLKKTIQDLASKISTLESDVKKSSEELIISLKREKKRENFNIQASSKCEAEKALLDAEMDLYNKQHKGDDTADLNAKVIELRQRAKSLGILPFSSSCFEIGLKQTSSEVVLPNATSTPLKRVESHPRTLVVTAFQKKDVLKKHFEQFETIEKIDENKAGRISICFNSREAAEMVLHTQNGKEIENEILHLSWYENQQISSELNEEHIDDKDDKLNLLDADEDEDEEEDSEARSWRR